MLSGIMFRLRGQLPFSHSHPAPVRAANHPRLSLLGFRVHSVIGVLFLLGLHDSNRFGDLAHRFDIQCFVYHTYTDTLLGLKICAILGLGLTLCVGGKSLGWNAARAFDCALVAPAPLASLAPPIPLLLNYEIQLARRGAPWALGGS